MAHRGSPLAVSLAFLAFAPPVWAQGQTYEERKAAAEHFTSGDNRERFHRLKGFLQTDRDPDALVKFAWASGRWHPDPEARDLGYEALDGLVGALGDDREALRGLGPDYLYFVEDLAPWPRLAVFVALGGSDYAVDFHWSGPADSDLQRAHWEALDRLLAGNEHDEGAKNLRPLMQALPPKDLYVLGAIELSRADIVKRRGKGHWAKNAVGNIKEWFGISMLLLSPITYAVGDTGTHCYNRRDELKKMTKEDLAGKGRWTVWELQNYPTGHPEELFQHNVPCFVYNGDAARREFAADAWKDVVLTGRDWWRLNGPETYEMMSKLGVTDEWCNMGLVNTITACQVEKAEAEETYGRAKKTVLRPERLKK